MEPAETKTLNSGLRWYDFFLILLLLIVPANSVLYSAGTDSAYFIIHRLQKSTNSGESYKVSINEFNSGTLAGINLMATEQAREVWLIAKFKKTDKFTLKVINSQNEEVDGFTIDGAAGDYFFLEFNAAASYGTSKLRLLSLESGIEAFRNARKEYFVSTQQKNINEILSLRQKDAFNESKGTDAGNADASKTENYPLTITKESILNLDAEIESGTVSVTGQNPKFFALIIGIENYQDASIGRLDEPAKDAKDFYDVITMYYTFEKQNVFLLINSGRQEITKTFDMLVEKVSTEDNLLIFYAGHGHWDDKLKQGYWLPSDAKEGDRGTWFSNADLKTYIGGINARHTLLITDACFSGGIFKTREAFRDAKSDILELYKYPSRKAMTSGSLNVVPDKSVFVEYLIKRLLNNSDKYLTSEQLFSSFITAVINNSANNQVPQFGEIRDTGDEGGDFIFIKK